MGEINHLQTEHPEPGNLSIYNLQKTQEWVEDEGGWKNALVFNILHELQWEGCHGWLG